jgi:hypothetical protein
MVCGFGSSSGGFFGKPLATIHEKLKKVLLYLEQPLVIREAVTAGALQAMLDAKETAAVEDFLCCNDATFDNLSAFRYEQLLCYVKEVLVRLRGESLIPKNHAKLLLRAMDDATFQVINPRISHPLDPETREKHFERLLYVQAHLITLPALNYLILQRLISVLVNISSEVNDHASFRRILVDVFSTCLIRKLPVEGKRWWQRPQKNWALSVADQSAERELAIFLVDNFTNIFGTTANGSNSNFHQLYESRTEECRRLQLATRQTSIQADYSTNRLLRFQHNAAGVLCNRRIVRRAFRSWRNYIQGIESGAQDRNDKMAALTDALLNERRRVASLEVEVKANKLHMELCTFDKRLHMQLQVLRAQPSQGERCKVELKVEEDLRQIHTLKEADAKQLG